MATTFNYELRDATAYSPQLLNASLSASDNSIVVNSFGTVDGKQVVAVLYNTLTSPSSATVSLSASDGFVIRVSTSYNGEPIVLEYADRSTSLITVSTSLGLTARQTVGAPGLEYVSPNTRRLCVLEMR